MATNLSLYDNTLHSLKEDSEKQNPGIQRRIKKLDIKKLDFEKLRRCSDVLNAKLHDKDFLKQNLYFFGENYEHNTTDDLLKVLGWNDDNYIIETGNLVGFISTEEFNLDITSRFGDNFLRYLLHYSDGFLELSDAGHVGFQGLNEWVLINLWKKTLMQAYRLGLPKQYIPQHEKQFTIRGSVDVLDYAINKGKDGKILCHFYQHDYNNSVTQIIAHTFSKLGNKPMLRDCLQLRNAFENCVAGKKVSLDACLRTKPITNPYYAEYNKVIWLSKKILMRQCGNLKDSGDASSSFLFDMSMLFEYFIRKVLLEGGLSLFPKNDGSMTISRGLGKNDDRHLYPDIIIDRGEDCEGKRWIDVYDVKYKYFNTEKGIKREDLFQLHTYVSYLSNDYRIRSCGIIYPQEGEEIAGTENILRHPDYKEGIPLRVVFLNIPTTDKVVSEEPKKGRGTSNKASEATAAEKYKEQMENYKNKFLENLRSLPNCE